MSSYIDGQNYVGCAPNITGEEDLIVSNLTVDGTISLSSGSGGINLYSGTTAYNINPTELSYLNNARSNLQQQIDNLNPDLSNNIGFWGSFWTNQDLTNPTANAVNLITYTNSDPDGYGIDLSNNSRIWVRNDGVYMFIITAQVQAPNTNTHTIYMWLRKNGTTVADTAFKEELKGSIKLITANWQLELNQDDYIEIAWQSDATDITLEYYASSGNVPAIPSVILTASQITFQTSILDEFEVLRQEVKDLSQNIIDLSSNVYGILTGVSYNAGSDTTAIDNNLSVSGNASVGGRITRGTYQSPVSNNEYVMKEYVDTQDAYYYNLATQPITGISYNSGTDTTTVSNNMTVSGNLSIQVLNGNTVPLNSYIDEQVNVAYQRANYGIDLANNAQNSANAAANAASNAQSTADGALALAGGASAGVAGLGAVVAQHTTDIAALGATVASQGASITTLEIKTQNINAIPSETTFTGQIILGSTTMNGGTVFTPTLDAQTAVYTPTIGSNTAILNITPAVQNLQGTTINIGKSTGGSVVNIATDGTLNGVNIGNLTTPVFINNTLYTPFTPANLASFLKQFTY